MKTTLFFILAASTLMVAGCSSTFRTFEYKDGKTVMTEDDRNGSAPRTWELKEVSSSAEINTLRQDGWKYEDVLHHPGGADTFLMKRKLVVQTAAPPPFQPMLITALGSTTTSADGILRVMVSAAGDSVEVSYIQSPKATGAPITLTSTLSVPGQTAQSPGWKAHAGWFVFLENESRVWVYDGDRYLCLMVESAGGASFYPTPRGFPCAVPAEVFSRLSGPAQKDVPSHG